MNIMTDGTGIMGEITNNIGLTMESDVFSPVSVVFFRKSMQLKGYNTKNEYMGLQQSKIGTLW